MSPAAGHECLAISHVPFEGPGLIAAILRERGREVRILEAGVDDLAVVDAIASALLVVLGGPIGVNDEADYPFSPTRSAFSNGGSPRTARPSASVSGRS